MKRLFSFVTGMTFLLMLTTHGAYAEDSFPDFKTSQVRLYIPIESIDYGYQEDIAHEVGFNFSYNINSQMFTEQNQGHIQTIAEGFSGSTDKSTPWKVLTELLAAYHSMDADAVRSLYTDNSQSEINELLSDPTVKQRFVNYMNAVEGMNVLLGFYHKDGFVALVDLLIKNKSETRLTPFYFVESAQGYLLSAITLDQPITANISLFLQTGHSIAELPAPKHGLSVEKSGTGNGIVNGSGIDCGEDCVEVFVEGTAVWLKAEADEYSIFEGWLLDGEVLKDRLVIQDDTVVTAMFSKIPPKEYALSLEKSGTGDGSVTDSETGCDTQDCLEVFSIYADLEEAPVVESGTDCGENCSIAYTEGTTIYLKATPVEGAEFVEWRLNGETVSGPVEIFEDTVIEAIFNEIAEPEEETPISREPVIEEPQTGPTQP